jgi:hypothetical protein
VQDPNCLQVYISELFLKGLRSLPPFLTAKPSPKASRLARKTVRKPQHGMDFRYQPCLIRKVHVVNTDNYHLFSHLKTTIRTTLVPMKCLRLLRKLDCLANGRYNGDSLNPKNRRKQHYNPQMHPQKAIKPQPNITGLRAYLLLVVLPIVTGSVIYVLFRDSNILLFVVFDPLGLWTPTRFDPGRLANTILCSLPDGLWVFAFASWMRLIWGRHWFWCNLPICIGIGSEIGQLFELVPGTFDFLDVQFYSLGHLLSQRWRNG